MRRTNTPDTEKKGKRLNQSDSSSNGKFHIPVKIRLFIGVSILGILFSALITTVTYINFKKQLRNDTRQRLLDIVSVASLLVNPDAQAILTKPEQENSGLYLTEKRKLQEIRDSAGNLEYVYTMRFVGDQIEFVVDAETNPEDISHLGDIYYEAEPEFLEDMANLTEPMVDSVFYTDRWGTFLSAYAPLYTSEGNIDTILGIDMRVDDVLLHEKKALMISILTFMLSVPFILLAVWFLSKVLVKPLREFTRNAQMVASGNFNTRIPVTGNDEIAKLASAFNMMAKQLALFISELEHKVVERTQEIEQQTKLLESTTQVGKAITSILDVNKLKSQVVELIQKDFNLYYVGLFLLDDKKEWAILQSGTGEAGKIMLKRKHKIKVGSGMIGWCIQNNQLRIAQEADKDTIRLATKELPETRSEAALPLHSRGKVIGALTIQSTQSNAFDIRTLKILQMMADLVAIAIDNADLFQQSNQAFERIKIAYGETSKSSWDKIIQHSKVVGYSYDIYGLHSIKMKRNGFNKQQKKKQEQVHLTTEKNKDNKVKIPITVRDLYLGSFEASKKDNSEWTEDELEFIESFIEQLGIALDSARLYQETQNRAEREKLVTEITTKMRASNNPDDIMQTAIKELKKSLQAKDVHMVLNAQRGKSN